MTSLILAAMLNIQTADAHVPHRHQHAHAHHHRARKPKPVVHMRWVWVVGHWEQRGPKTVWVRGHWELRPSHHYHPPRNNRRHR